MTTQWPYDTNGRRVLPRGCRVTDDGPCPQGLFIDEHRLSEAHQWIHPVGMDPHTGYWIWDEDNE